MKKNIVLEPELVEMLQKVLDNQAYNPHFHYENLNDLIHSILYTVAFARDAGVGSEGAALNHLLNLVSSEADKNND